jgi:hypothetical protein
MEKDSFFIFVMYDIRCQWRKPTPVKMKGEENEGSGNFFPDYFVKILLIKIQKWRWKYETLVSKSKKQGVGRYLRRPW